MHGRAEPAGAAAQLTLMAPDQAEQVRRVSWAERGVRRQDVAKDGAVVTFTKAAVERFELALVECEAVAAPFLQQADLQPLILHTLAPRVVSLASRTGHRLGHRAPNGTRSPLQSGSHGVEARLAQRPVLHAVTLCTQQRGGSVAHILQGRLVVGERCAAQERRANCRDRLRW